MAVDEKEGSQLATDAVIALEAAMLLSCDMTSLPVAS